MKLNEAFWAAFAKDGGHLGGSPESVYIGSTQTEVVTEIQCWAGVDGCCGVDEYDLKRVKMIEVNEP